MRRAYEWTYPYAALDPTTGESFCLYLPGMDGLCLEAFLENLGRAYTECHLLVVLDGAPSHTSGQITLPENVSLLRLPAYSPEPNPLERWFQEFRRTLSKRIFETVELLQDALTKVLEPYWQDPVRLRSLTGFPLVGGSHRVVGTSMLLIGIIVAAAAEGLEIVYGSPPAAASGGILAAISHVRMLACGSLRARC